jgi:hypothetical protein
MSVVDMPIEEPAREPGQDFILDNVSADILPMGFTAQTAKTG